MKNFDVIIVGGGPAGCAAAIHAASQKLKVCILERETFPRHRPGETLHPGVESLFKQLGVLNVVEREVSVRHAGIYVQWESKNLQFQPYQPNEDQEPWLGYQAYRSVLDNILLERAKSLGVQALMPARINELKYNDNHQTYEISVNNEILSAPYLIDASGSWHYLARELDIPIETYSKKLYSRYGYVEGMLEECDGLPTIIADSEGWTWTALIDKGFYQWTRLSFEEKPIAATWKPPIFKRLHARGTPKGADVTWRMVAQPAGRGYFIVGDAAIVLDPASSHGVLRALMSGIKAADLIAHTLHQVCEEAVAVQEYNRWLFEWFSHDITKLKELYGKLSFNVQ